MSLLMLFLPVLFYLAAAAAFVVLIYGLNILRIGSKSPYYRLKQKQLITGWKWIGLGLLIGSISIFILQKAPAGLPLMPGGDRPTSTATQVPVATTPPTRTITSIPPTLTLEPTSSTLQPAETPVTGNTKAPTFTPTLTFTPKPTNTKAPTFTPSLTNTKAPTWTPTIKPTFAPTWTQKVVAPTITNTLAPTFTMTPGN